MGSAARQGTFADWLHFGGVDLRTGSNRWQMMKKMNTDIVTTEMIDRVMTRKGGLNKESFAYLGVAWPPKAGWKKRIIGKPRCAISGSQERLFFS